MRKLLEVAEKFGWTPEGTVVDENSAKRNSDYMEYFNLPTRSNLGGIASV
jgi:hypothetical protein